MSSKLLKDLSDSAQLMEGRVDPNIIMNIDAMVSAGKVTNRIQYIIIAKIMEMLKYGNFYHSSNFNEIETPKQLLDHVRAMPDQELVKLATSFRELLHVKDLDLLGKYANPTQPLADWIRYVTKAQE